MYNLSYDEQKILIEIMHQGKLAMMSNRINKMSEQEMRENWKETAEFDILLQSVINKVEKGLIENNFKRINKIITRDKKQWHRQISA